MGGATNCYNTGEVSAFVPTNNAFTFGTTSVCGIGSNMDNILNCYNAGAISVTNLASVPTVYIGGIAANSSHIENCYNIGNISVNASPHQGYPFIVGGICGGGSINNCYALDLYDSVSGTQLASAQMKDKANLVGFDFDAIWDISSSVNGGYPFLRNLPGGDIGDIKPPTSRIEVDFGTQGKKMEINWKNDYFSTNAIQYNHDLAIASLVLSDAAYSKSSVEKTLGDLGFSNVKTYEYNDDNFINAGHAIAKKEIGGFTVIAIAIRGTPSLSGVFKGEGGALEWLSGIIGWINAASVEVNKNLLTYLADLNYPKNVKIWITGHSRGAAVANFMGAALSDGIYGQSNVFSYGFASPNTVALWGKGDYKNIYYWKNSHDYLVTNTPILMGKYGVPDKFTPDETTKNHYTLLTGKTYSSAANAANPFSSDAHSTEIYMAHLLGEKTVSEQLSSRTIIVRCPVDIKVYNEMNKLVGLVVNNVVDTSIDPEVLIWLDGDEKYISLPPEGVFTFDMTATDVGTMSFHIGYTDLDTWDIQEEKTFRNVTLFAGKTMTSTIGDSITASNTQLFVTDNTGKPIATVSTDGTETPVTQKEYFKLWGKVTRWEKTLLNWFLLIVCFGWVWMWF